MFIKQKEDERRSGINRGETRTVPSSEDNDKYETIHLVPIETSSSSKSKHLTKPTTRAAPNKLIIGEVQSSFVIEGENGTMSNGSFAQTVSGTLYPDHSRAEQIYSNGSNHKTRNTLLNGSRRLLDRHAEEDEPYFGGRYTTSHSLVEDFDRPAMYNIDSDDPLKRSILRRSLVEDNRPRFCKEDVPFVLGFRPELFEQAVDDFRQLSQSIH